MTTETDLFFDVGEKYKSVLNALLEQNYQIMNDVYLNMFISHLSGKHEEDFSYLKWEPFTFDWIVSSIKKIINEPNKSVQGFAFTCQFLSLLTENVEYFRKFHEQSVYSNLQRGINESKDLQYPSSKLALITLYQSMLKHKDGLKWLKQESAWKNAIGYCLEDQTIYLVRRAISFITDFLFEIVNDDSLCFEVITEITNPITDNVFTEHIENVYVDGCDLQRKVTPSINIISSIFERYIEVNQKSSIVYHISKTKKVQVNLWKLFNMTYDRTFVETLNRCCIYMSYAMLTDTLFMETISDKESFDCDNFGLNFFNTCKMCILRNQHEALLSAVRLYYVLWTKMGDRVPEEIILGNQLSNFENQVIVLQILPLINFMHRSESCYPELHDDYIMKLFQISTEHTLRVCYSFRDSLFDSNVDLYDVAAKSIRGILSMIHVLHRDRAVTIFQALCHVVKGVKRSESKPCSLIEKPALLSAVITGLYTIVKKYRITWKESTESIALLNVMLCTLENPNLTPQLAVEVLKLAQLSVEHFLAPNLALLVDTLSGSDMQKLGPVILKRLHDSNWEVRDSAMELLASMANISLLKFPAFQQHILSFGLCTLVSEIAKNDSEYYVRASALNCIAQMVPVNLFWEQCFESLDLVTFLINVLKTEDEGVVRCQAVSVITCICENQRFPSNQLDSVYEAMAFAAIQDLFWEVKVKAIEFWRCVIERHLQYQGVIDGSFPSVTFSKEHKRIVTLTQQEITRRLTKVLTRLSGCGCLGVLLATLDDQDDLLVLKNGVSTIKTLTAFFDKYGYCEEVKKTDIFKAKSLSIIETSTTPDESASNSCINMDDNESKDLEITKGTYEVIDSDEVIQSIVNAQDINLLSKTYENQMNIDSMGAPQIQIDYKGFFEKVSSVTPLMFVEKLKATNLEELVQERIQWIAHVGSLSSLLNDMLYSLQAHESHDADCY